MEQLDNHKKAIIKLLKEWDKEMEEDNGFSPWREYTREDLNKLIRKIRKIE